MAGEIVQQLRHRHGRGRPDAPPAKGRRRRGRAVKIADNRWPVRSRRNLNAAIPPERGKRRHGRVPSPTPPEIPVLRRWPVLRGAEMPPQAVLTGQHRRGRVPGTGLDASAFLVALLRRGKADRLASSPVPAAGRCTRRQPPAPLQTPIVRRRREVRPAGPPPARGRHRHSRLPLLGLDPFGRLPGRRASRIERAPPAHGQHRRRRVPFLAFDPTAFVVRRHRQAHHAPTPPPARGQRRHSRVPKLSLDPTAFVVKRHRSGQRGAKAPPFAGTVRHGRRPNFGLAAPQANYIPRRHRPRGSPCWAWRVPHRRRPRLPGLVVTAGPFYLSAGQIYGGGAVDGQAEDAS